MRAFDLIWRGIPKFTPTIRKTLRQVFSPRSQECLTVAGVSEFVSSTITLNVFLGD